MQAGQTLCERTVWLTQRRQLTGRGAGVPATAAGTEAAAAGGGAAGLTTAGAAAVDAGLVAIGAEDVAATEAGPARGATGGGIAAAKASGVATSGSFAPAPSATRGASATRNVAPHRHFTLSLGCAALSSGTGMLRPQPTQRTVIQ